MAKILVLHGPNLNLLGVRETELYGNVDLATINASLVEAGEKLGHQVEHMQSNAEHELIAAIHYAKDSGIEFVIINPAGYTHTSVALRDALLAVQLPFIEVHLSNIFARELFRYTSYLSDIALGVISGLGAQVYELALQAANNYFVTSKETEA